MLHKWVNIDTALLTFFSFSVVIVVCFCLQFQLTAPTGMLSLKAFQDVFLDLASLTHGTETLPDIWTALTPEKVSGPQSSQLCSHTWEITIFSVNRNNSMVAAQFAPGTRFTEQEVFHFCCSEYITFSNWSEFPDLRWIWTLSNFFC